MRHSVAMALNNLEVGSKTNSEKTKFTKPGQNFSWERKLCQIDDFHPYTQGWKGINQPKKEKKLMLAAERKAWYRAQQSRKPVLSGMQLDHTGVGVTK